MNWAILVNLALQLLPQLIPQGNQIITQGASAIAAYDHDTVKWVQHGLNQIEQLNPPLIVDGIWGPKTKAAVEAFAAKHGLPAGGVLSHVVILAIQRALG